MQIVIEIDEEEYEKNKTARCDYHTLRMAIMTGAPLPKGHGRLIDGDVLREEISSWGMNDYEPLDFIDEIDMADVIIGADKGE